MQLQTIPTGTVRTFGECSVLYVVGDPVHQLPDGDWLVQIEVLETGENTPYRLSEILQNPQAK